MDPASEAHLSLVHPWLAHLARLMHDQLSEHGIPIVVAQGLRSWADQQADWMKGRDAAGKVVNEAQVVTGAPPGHSWHNYGLAIDVCPVMFLHLPDWGAGRAEWHVVVAIGERIGLTSGSRFVHPKPDWPHFQITGAFGASPDDEVRRIFRETGPGLEWVWREAKIGPATI